MRQDILNDIHDGVGALLNLMLWDLRLNGLPSATVLESELQRCADEMRFAIQPPGATAQTLEHLLGKLCERLQHSCRPLGIELSFREIGHPSPELSSTAGHELYKACQESLSNALRHSQASRIAVELRHIDTDLQLTICDNGQGIPHWNNSTQQQAQIRPDALGLKSLHARFKGLGGQVHIQSGDVGTCIVLTLPARASSRHRLLETLPQHPWVLSLHKLRQPHYLHDQKL